MARVAAPTVEAERNVSSSPVSEAASEVRPPGGGFASRESSGSITAPYSCCLKVPRNQALV
jgi:hypothetical protein